MFELKRITHEAIPGALARAERYRLLNEPEEAESICLDILAVAPDNQSALVMLLLALTDQFRAGQRAECFTEAQAVLPRLAGEYERFYYAGIIWERRATARLDHGGAGGTKVVAPWIARAMDYYEKAEAIRPAGNDDAILRWNTCARLSMRHRLGAEPEPAFEPALDD
jgi:hypothetical protein